MDPGPDNVQSVEREHPEWRPWIAMLKLATQEAGNAAWERFVPERSGVADLRTPELARVHVDLDRALMEGWAHTLFEAARASGAENLARLNFERRADWPAVFAAALRCDEDHLRQMAEAHGADASGFNAVAMLLPLPFLQACNRKWAAKRAPGWNAGYCPTCGAWPAFAEIRGIERTRYLRCSRCGSEWEAYALSCPYCGMADHNQLFSLVAEQASSTWVIEACNRCLGYLKCFTTLRGSPPLEVVMQDLASVELDLAAVARGYKRPGGAGYAFEGASAFNDLSGR